MEKLQGPPTIICTLSASSCSPGRSVRNDATVKCNRLNRTNLHRLSETINNMLRFAFRYFSIEKTVLYRQTRADSGQKFDGIQRKGRVRLIRFISSADRITAAANWRSIVCVKVSYNALFRRILPVVASLYRGENAKIRSWEGNL